MAMPHYPHPARGLTPRDRELLWLMSQGMTYGQVGRKLGLAEHGVKSAARRAMYRMGAVNIVQAVSVALLEGQIGRWQDCGTHAAYQKHRKLHQTADPACLLAKAEHDRAYRAVLSGRFAGIVQPDGSVLEKDQTYRDTVSGRRIKVSEVEPDSRVQVVDTRTGRMSYIHPRFFYSSPLTRFGKTRRSGYVLIRDTGEQR